MLVIQANAFLLRGGLLCDAAQLLLFLRVGCSEVSYTRHIVTQHWTKNLSSEAKNHLTNKTEREKKLNHYYYYHSERKWNLNHHYKRALIINKKKTFPNLHFRKSVLIHFLLLWAWFFCFGNWSTRISYTIFKSPLNLSTWLEHLFE